MTSNGLLCILCVILQFHNVQGRVDPKWIERIENRLQDLEESNRELKEENSNLKGEIIGLLRNIQRENVAFKLTLNGLERKIDTDVLNDENQPSFPEEVQSTTNGRINETNRNGIMKNKSEISDTVLMKRCKNVVPRIIPPTSVSASQTVAFYAYMNSFVQAGIPAHVNLTFDTVKINEGNGYSKHDGVFIVPVNGVYAYHWSLRIIQHSWASVEIIVNGRSIGCASTDSSDSYGTGSELVVTHANAGDHVFLRTQEAVSGYIFSKQPLAFIIF